MRYRRGLAAVAAFAVMLGGGGVASAEKDVYPERYDITNQQAGNIEAELADTEIYPEGEQNYNTITVNEQGYTIEKRDGTSTTVEQSPLELTFFGGIDDTAEAVVQHNAVVLNSGTCLTVAGGYSEFGTVENCSVAIHGGESQRHVFGGSVNWGKASQNRVTMDGGRASGTIVTGAVANSGGRVTDNSVMITGGEISPRSASTVQGISGAWTYQTEASGNSVVIGGTAVIKAAWITGAYMVSGSYQEGQLVNNTVTIKGGTIHGSDIYAVSGQGETRADSSEGNSKPSKYHVENNRIILERGAEQAGLENSALYGWYFVTHSIVTHAGNTLEVNTTGVTVKQLANFDNIKFTQASSDHAALTVTDLDKGALKDTMVDAGRIRVSKDALEGAAEGRNTMTLLNGSGQMTGLQTGNLVSTDSEWSYGSVITGRGLVSVDEIGNVLYTMDGASAQANEQTHSAVMGSSAVISAVSGAAVNSVTTAAQSLMAAAPGDTLTYANFGGGTDKHKTGSDVTSHMWLGSVGAGTKVNLKDGGSLTYGAFFEYGKGNYTTKNERATVSRGDGKLSYQGGGISLRYTTPSKFPDGESDRYGAKAPSVCFYAEFGAHAGRVKNEANHVLFDDYGNVYGYETRTGYFGLNLGVGQLYQVNDRSEVDVYGMFYYNHSNGSSFSNTDADGDESRFSLDSVNSKLLRIGARYNYRMNKAAKLYAGAAFDYEFDSEAGGSVSVPGTAFSGRIRSADSKGASGMLELGVKLESDESPWVLELGAKAYAGRHSGVMGNLGIKFLF